jgi:hypothetical protein
MYRYLRAGIRRQNSNKPKVQPIIPGFLRDFPIPIIPVISHFSHTQVRNLKSAMKAPGKGSVKRFSAVEAAKALAAGRINLDEPFLIEGGLSSLGAPLD